MYIQDKNQIASDMFKRAQENAWRQRGLHSYQDSVQKSLEKKKLAPLPPSPSRKQIFAQPPKRKLQ